MKFVSSIILMFFIASCGTNKTVKKDEKKEVLKVEEKVEKVEKVEDNSLSDEEVQKEFSTMMNKYKLDKKSGDFSYLTYLDSLNKISDDYERYPEIGFNLGSLSLKLSKFDQAYDYLLKTYKKSKHIPTLINLAYVSYKTNKIKEVLPLLKEAFLIEGIEPDLRERLLGNYSFLLIVDKNYSEALKVIRETLSFKPRSIAAYKNLGILYINSKKFSLAEEVIDLSIGYTKDKKEKAGLYVVKAKYYEAKVESVKMIASYKKAISLDKLNIDANYALGLLYMKYGAGDKAVIYLKTLVGNYSDNLLFNNLYAISLRMAKQYKKSFEVYNDLIKSEPSYKDTYYNRGILLQKYMENPADAIKDYEKYISLGGKKKDVNARIKTCKQMVKDIEMIKAEEKAEAEKNKGKNN